MSSTVVANVFNILANTHLESFVSYGIATIATILILTGCMLVVSAVINTIKASSYEEDDVIECVGLESISAEEYLNMEDLQLVQVETDVVEIRDNAIYLDTEYVRDQVVEVMESETISLWAKVEMSFIFPVRRFVRLVQTAQQQIDELSARVQELEEAKQFDFDFYGDLGEDAEVIMFRKHN